MERSLLPLSQRLGWALYQGRGMRGNGPGPALEEPFLGLDSLGVDEVGVLDPERQGVASVLRRNRPPVASIVRAGVVYVGRNGDSKVLILTFRFVYFACGVAWRGVAQPVSVLLSVSASARWCPAENI
jgi:hypothetical protein